MKRIAIVLPALLVTSIVSYQMYEHYWMSRDLRRSLMAICDSHTTWADEQQYMRGARVQTRTARDREVFQNVQSGVDDIFQYSHCGDDLDATLRQININTENLHERLEAGLITTRNMSAEQKSIVVQINAAKSTYDQCQSQEHEAQAAFQTVRDRYGLND